MTGWMQRRQVPLYLAALAVGAPLMLLAAVAWLPVRDTLPPESRTQGPAPRRK